MTNGQWSSKIDSETCMTKEIPPQKA